MRMLEGEWKQALEEECSKEYFLKLLEFVEEEAKEYRIFPPLDEVFCAFHYTELSKVHVVILGQDPYHEEGQAHGLCFSVRKGVKIPPSLVNIYKELHSDMGYEIPGHGYLESWAKQGVLMLNTVLTVREGKANSHQKKGWETFTDSVIQKLNQCEQPMVFILWGKPAQTKRKMLNNPKHLILEAPHPSPLSSYRGFFGSAPFSKTNAFLKSQGCEEINWKISDCDKEDKML